MLSDTIWFCPDRFCTPAVCVKLVKSSGVGSVTFFVMKRTNIANAGVVTCVLYLQVVYFYPDMDIALLKEVVAQNPFRNNGKWSDVTEVVNTTIQQTRPSTPDILERTLKEHLTTLLKHFEQDNNASLKKCVD